MELKSPVMITPRLLPGVRIDKTFISIEYITKRNHEGRTEYRVHIDNPKFTYTDESTASGCQGGTLQEGLSTFLNFLSYAGETKETDNPMFPENVTEFARKFSEEIGMMGYDLALDSEEPGEYIKE